MQQQKQKYGKTLRMEKEGVFLVWPVMVREVSSVIIS